MDSYAKIIAHASLIADELGVEDPELVSYLSGRDTFGEMTAIINFVITCNGNKSICIRFEEDSQEFSVPIVPSRGMVNIRRYKLIDDLKRVKEIQKCLDVKRSGEND